MRTGCASIALSMDDGQQQLLVLATCINRGEGGIREREGERERERERERDREKRTEREKRRDGVALTTVVLDHLGECLY